MFKSVLRRLRKGVRDIGSGISDFAQDNPLITLGAAAYGLPALLGKMGMTSPGSNIFDLITKGIGKFDKTIISPTSKSFVEGSGLLGGIQDIYQDLSGKEKLAGIMGIVNTILAKKQFEDEQKRVAEELAKQEEKANFVSNYIGSPTGGSPYAKDMFTTYDPIEVDSEGKATNYPYAKVAKGGIPQLKMGGTGGPGPSPFNPNNKISGMIPAMAMGGETTGVPGLSADMSNTQMMNKIENNPGITAFFPRKLGMISGPGGPKEDKIPAMLSDGEFVFTAKAVENAGGPRAMYKMMNKLDPESSKGKGII